MVVGGVAALIVLGSGGDGAVSLSGLTLAFGCAVTWAVYSVLSRRLGDVPTESVTVYCLATAVLSVIAHVVLERTVWPEGAIGWLSVVALGIGPVGAAFFTWDIGMKKGDIQLLGVASYAAPLLSTLALVAAGITEPSWTILLAAVLIARRRASHRPGPRTPHKRPTRRPATTTAASSTSTTEPAGSPS